MARVKQTARLDEASDLVISFAFGILKVTSRDLDKYSNRRWFQRSLVRHCEGESKPQPHDDRLSFLRSSLMRGCCGHLMSWFCWEYALEVIIKMMIL